MKIKDATIGCLVQLNSTPEDGPTMTVIGARNAYPSEADPEWVPVAASYHSERS